MAELVERRPDVVTRPIVEERVGTDRLAYQAYQVLHVAFVIAPTIAGIDKFLHWLVNWDQYLAPQVARILPFSGHTFMLAVGVIEIIAGLWVAIQPRVGAYIVAVWLLGIIGNLVIQGRYLDIALRDLGLLLAAYALGRLAQHFHRPAVERSTEVRRSTV